MVKRKYIFRWILMNFLSLKIKLYKFYKIKEEVIYKRELDQYQIVYKIEVGKQGNNIYKL